MDNREKIIDAARKLIAERGSSLETITVREICSRAGVGLGLVNYYFGSRDRLMELCVEQIINGVVKSFEEIRDSASLLSPFETLDRLGNLTLTFLFEHEAVARISMLSDMKKPGNQDNTHRTWEAYLPLVAACRPDWDPPEVKRHTFTLISAMQQSFLRYEEIRQDMGIDLKDASQRTAYHRQMLQDILGVAS